MSQPSPTTPQDQSVYPGTATMTLRELRRAQGITQTELAEKLGVTQTRVSTLECGSVERSQVGTLSRFVEALGGTVAVHVTLGGKTVILA